MNQVILTKKREHLLEHEDYSVQLVVNPDQMNRMINNLKTLFPRGMLCQLDFPNYTRKETFDRLLRIQTQKQSLIHYDYNFRQLTQNQSTSIIKQKQSKTRQIQQNLNRYHFVLKNPGHINVFFKVYFQKIIQLQVQYNCLIIPKKQSICVATKENKLSLMLRQIIINMISEQKIFTTSQKDLVYKLNFSKKCMQIIKKENIEYQVFLPQTLLNLHSHNCSFNQIIKIVQQKLSFHVTLLVFVSRTIDYYVSFQLIKLIALQSLPIIEYIRSKFQIQIQTNPQHLCFILHDLSIAFSRQPCEYLLQNMANFRLFHLQGDTMRSVQNYINKNKNAFSFAKWTYKYRKMFFLVNSANIQKEQDIYNLLKVFIADLNERSSIIIYMHPTQFLKDQRSEQLQRLIGLTQKYNLHISNFTNLIINSYQTKLIINLKSFSALTKKQKQNQVYNFFREYMINGPIYFHQNLLQNSSARQVIVTNKIFRKSKSINKEQSFSIINQKDNFVFSKNQQRIDLSCIPFCFPQRKDLPVVQYFSRTERNKSTRNIQNQLLQKVGIAFKIYKISIDKSVEIRQTQIREQYEIYFVQNIFKQGKIINYHHICELEIDKLQVKQKGYIVFISKKDKSIIPSYFFQRI